MSGGVLNVGEGFVDGNVPYLSGRLMNGLQADNSPDPKGVPSLVLKEDLFDDTGRSWIVLRLKVDEDGRFPSSYKEADLSIVQTDQRLLAPGFIGQTHLALLRRQPSARGLGILRQISRWDFQHTTSKDADGKFRHFFAPA